ncbi:serine--tRNA ligase, mitochondrial-like [Morphnus guianensis]
MREGAAPSEAPPTPPHVQTWSHLGEVRATIACLEAEKGQVAQGMQAPMLPAYMALLAHGCQVQLQLQALLAEEAALDERFYLKALQLPNHTHSEAPIRDESQAHVLEVVGEKPVFDFKPKGHLELGEGLDIICQQRLSHISGHHSYYLCGAGTLLQHALVRFAMAKLLPKEGCGMQPNTTPSPIYNINPSHFEDLCLDGTSEVGITGYFMDHAMWLEDLPIRVICSSTCYWAETNTGQEPWGLYRIHQFTMVEMFRVTAAESGDESEVLLAEFLALQKEISELGLHYCPPHVILSHPPPPPPADGPAPCSVLNMPTQKLGLPAYRKFNIEAWMPRQGKYGEISSTSNCTDYQSWHLNIMYSDRAGQLRHAHTVNSTACAVSQMLIALLECNQLLDVHIHVPPALQPLVGQAVLTQPPAPLLRYIGLNQPGGGGPQGALSWGG